MWVPSLPELQRVCVGASWMTLWMKMIFLLFFLLAGKQNVSEMMSWGMSLFRNKRSFCLLGLSSAGILSESVIKLRKEPLAEKVVIPWVPKGLWRRQSGMWELSYPTESGAPPSPWAQEITCSSWELSQPCVFPLQLVFLSGGRSELSLLDEFIIPAHEVCKDLKIHIPVWSWILLGAVGSAAPGYPFCPDGKKYLSSFQAKYCRCRLDLEVLQPCLNWSSVCFGVFFIMFVLQVEIIFPSGRHLMAFVGGISFTQWWICCREWENVAWGCWRVVVALWSSLMDSSAVYMGLLRRKSNTFG